MIIADPKLEEFIKEYSEQLYYFADENNVKIALCWWPEQIFPGYRYLEESCVHDRTQIFSKSVEDYRKSFFIMLEQWFGRTFVPGVDY
jgi:hypothetical protein